MICKNSFVHLCIVNVFIEHLLPTRCNVKMGDKTRGDTVKGLPILCFSSGVTDIYEASQQGGKQHQALHLSSTRF